MATLASSASQTSVNAPSMDWRSARWDPTKETSSLPATAPQHPIPTMQGAFQESMLETLTDDLEPLTTSTKADSIVRRRRLLEQPTYERTVGGRWKQKAGENFHPLWKLVAQISFGMHLLHKGLAKSDEEVVKILQTHVDEIDGFLERTTEDFDLAQKDIDERVRYLKLPLEHGDVFDNMLGDRQFRNAILEGNEKIEHIVDRTGAALRDALKDVKKGYDGTRELARYFRRLDRTWDNRSEEHAGVYVAMMGNTEGWSTAFLELQKKGNRLHQSLVDLGTVIAEIQRRVGVASRKDVPSVHSKSVGPSSQSSLQNRSGAMSPIGMMNGEPSKSSAQRSASQSSSIRNVGMQSERDKYRGVADGQDSEGPSRKNSGRASLKKQQASAQTPTSQGPFSPPNPYDSASPRSAGDAHPSPYGRQSPKPDEPLSINTGTASPYQSKATYDIDYFLRSTSIDTSPLRDDQIARLSYGGESRLNAALPPSMSAGVGYSRSRGPFQEDAIQEEDEEDLEDEISKNPLKSKPMYTRNLAARDWGLPRIPGQPKTPEPDKAKGDAKKAEEAKPKEEAKVPEPSPKEEKVEKPKPPPLETKAEKKLDMAGVRKPADSPGSQEYDDEDDDELEDVLKDEEPVIENIEAKGVMITSSKSVGKAMKPQLKEVRAIRSSESLPLAEKEKLSRSATSASEKAAADGPKASDPPTLDTAIAMLKRASTFDSPSAKTNSSFGDSRPSSSLRPPPLQLRNLKQSPDGPDGRPQSSPTSYYNDKTPNSTASRTPTLKLFPTIGLGNRGVSPAPRTAPLEPTKPMSIPDPVPPLPNSVAGTVREAKPAEKPKTSDSAEEAKQPATVKTPSSPEAPQKVPTPPRERSPSPSLVALTSATVTGPEPDFPYGDFTDWTADTPPTEPQIAELSARPLTSDGSRENLGNDKNEQGAQGSDRALQAKRDNAQRRRETEAEQRANETRRVQKDIIDRVALKTNMDARNGDRQASPTSVGRREVENQTGNVGALHQAPVVPPAPERKAGGGAVGISTFYQNLSFGGSSKGLAPPPGGHIKQSLSVSSRKAFKKVFDRTKSAMHKRGGSDASLTNTPTGEVSRKNSTAQFDPTNPNVAAANPNINDQDPSSNPVPPVLQSAASQPSMNSAFQHPVNPAAASAIDTSTQPQPQPIVYPQSGPAASNPALASALKQKDKLASNLKQMGSGLSMRLSTFAAKHRKTKSGKDIPAFGPGSIGGPPLPTQPMPGAPGAAVGINSAAQSPPPSSWGQNNNGGMSWGGTRNGSTTQLAGAPPVPNNPAVMNAAVAGPISGGPAAQPPKGVVGHSHSNSGVSGLSQASNALSAGSTITPGSPADVNGGTTPRNPQALAADATKVFGSPRPDGTVPIPGVGTLDFARASLRLERDRVAQAMKEEAEREKASMPANPAAAAAAAGATATAEKKSDSESDKSSKTERRRADDKTRGWDDDSDEIIETASPDADRAPVLPAKSPVTEGSGDPRPSSSVYDTSATQTPSTATAFRTSAALGGGAATASSSTYDPASPPAQSPASGINRSEADDERSIKAALDRAVESARAQDPALGGSDRLAPSGLRESLSAAPVDEDQIKRASMLAAAPVVGEEEFLNSPEDEGGHHHQMMGAAAAAALAPGLVKEEGRDEAEEEQPAAEEKEDSERESRDGTPVPAAGAEQTPLETPASEVASTPGIMLPLEGSNENRAEEEAEAAKEDKSEHESHKSSADEEEEEQEQKDEEEAKSSEKAASDKEDAAAESQEEDAAAETKEEDGDDKKDESDDATHEEDEAAVEEKDDEPAKEDAVSEPAPAVSPEESKEHAHEPLPAENGTSISPPSSSEGAANEVNRAIAVEN